MSETTTTATPSPAMTTKTLTSTSLSTPTQTTSESIGPKNIQETSPATCSTTASFHTAESPSPAEEIESFSKSNSVGTADYGTNKSMVRPKKKRVAFDPVTNFDNSQENNYRRKSIENQVIIPIDSSAEGNESTPERESIVSDVESMLLDKFKEHKKKMKQLHLNHMKEHQLIRTKSSQSMISSSHSLHSEAKRVLHENPFAKFAEKHFVLKSKYSDESAHLTSFQAFRKEVGERIEGHAVTTLVIVLTVVDALIVFAEILLSNYESEASGYRIAHTVLHVVGLTILGLFLLEVSLKIFAFGREFFKKPVFVFDALVIIVSFVLEIVFNNIAGDLLGLLILLRIWRIIRLLYSAGLIQANRMQSRIKFERQKRKAQKQFYEETIEELLNIISSERLKQRFKENSSVETG